MHRIVPTGPDFDIWESQLCDVKNQVETLRARKAYSVDGRSERSGIHAPPIGSMIDRQLQGMIKKKKSLSRGNSLADFSRDASKT